MRGIAMSDIHLGFTSFSREVGGRNGRETDVERAWERAIDNAIERQPDLITIAGDCFHNPRPSMHAVLAWRNGIRRLVQETDAIIVAIQGNHDAVRSSSAKSPIHVPDDYDRVFIVTEPRRIPLGIPRTGEIASIAVFPFVAMGTGEAYKVEPDSLADVNVLVVHAAVKGSEDGDLLPTFYGSGGALDVGREADRWDVIACGDFHEFRRLHPTRMAFYSGSIERTSSNIWPEHGPKGVVAYDTATGEFEFVEHPTRPIGDYDLGDFNQPPGVGAETVNYCLGQMAGYDHIADEIVRFRVDGFPRSERELIDWRLVRDLKANCFHFQLDLHFAKEGSVVVRDRREDGSRSIEDAARAFFAGDRPGVQAVAFEHLGIDRVDDAEVEVEPELVGGAA